MLQVVFQIHLKHTLQRKPWLEPFLSYLIIFYFGSHNNVKYFYNILNITSGTLSASVGAEISSSLSESAETAYGPAALLRHRYSLLFLLSTLTLRCHPDFVCPPPSASPPSPLDWLPASASLAPPFLYWEIKQCTEKPKGCIYTSQLFCSPSSLILREKKGPINCTNIPGTLESRHVTHGVFPTKDWRDYCCFVPLLKEPNRVTAQWQQFLLRLGW